MRPGVIGTFLGYAPGVVHRLDVASEWEQVGVVKEHVDREHPRLSDHLRA